METMIADIWFAGDIEVWRAKDLASKYSLKWSDVEAEYGRLYEEMERLSHG